MTPAENPVRPPRSIADPMLADAPPNANPNRPAMPPTTPPFSTAPQSMSPLAMPSAIAGAMPMPAPISVIASALPTPGKASDRAMPPTRATLPHCTPVSRLRMSSYCSIDRGWRPSGSTKSTGSLLP